MKRTSRRRYAAGASLELYHRHVGHVPHLLPSRPAVRPCATAGRPVCSSNPVLGFVPLPRPCVLRSREAWGYLDEVRYVGVSAGSLRFVDTYRRGGAPDTVTVSTLRDSDATEWTLEHEAAFADDTYKATGLPMTAPVLAVIHPHNPAVVYFFLQDHLFAVDVPARKVVGCERYHLVAPPREYGERSPQVKQHCVGSSYVCYDD